MSSVLPSPCNASRTATISLSSFFPTLCGTFSARLGRRSRSSGLSDRTASRYAILGSVSPRPLRGSFSSGCEPLHGLTDSLHQHTHRSLWFQPASVPHTHRHSSRIFSPCSPPLLPLRSSAGAPRHVGQLPPPEPLLEAAHVGDEPPPFASVPKDRTADRPKARRARSDIALRPHYGRPSKTRAIRRKERPVGKPGPARRSTPRCPGRLHRVLA